MTSRRQHQHTEIHDHSGLEQDQIYHQHRRQQQQQQQLYNYTLEFDVLPYFSAVDQQQLSESCGNNSKAISNQIQGTKSGIAKESSNNISKAWEAADIFSDLKKLDLKDSGSQSSVYGVAKTIITASKVVEFQASVDWRFGAVELFDLAELSQQQHQQEQLNNNSTRLNNKKTMTSTKQSRSGPVMGAFLGYGVVRLFKSPATAAVAEDEEDKDLYVQPSVPTTDNHTEDETKTSTILCVLAVPSYMTPYDLMQYFDDGYADSITHYRLVRSAGLTQSPSESNHFMSTDHSNISNMVLIKFRNEAAAARFYSHFNGRTFNSLEPETCHVVYVQHVRNKTMRSIPALPDDPFVEGTFSSLSSTSATLTAAVELPTCPVCLERMDSSVTGLLTIQCQHTFHCQCLTKWRDGSCPVCRYSSSNRRDNGTSSNGLAGSSGFRGDTDTTNRVCAVCQATNNLWICLICGHLGCGRYDQAHAHDHYTATGHCFAMDVESQRVWDYGADGYVHRLMQNQEDGKLVEIPSPMPPPVREPGVAMEAMGTLENGNEHVSSGTFGTSGFPKVSIAGSSGTKLKQDVGEQFARLLASQLDSQREYYEALLSTAVERISLLNSTEQRLQESFKEQEELKQVQAGLEHELDKARAKAARLQENYEKALHRYIEERAINERTIEKVQRLETKHAHSEAELADLREQVRDLMFFHEAQERFKDVDDEIKEGQVIIETGPSSSKKKKKSRKKKNEIVITTK